MKKVIVIIGLLLVLIPWAFADQVTVTGASAPVNLGPGVTGMEAFDGSMNTAVSFPSGAQVGGFDIQLAKPVLLGKLQVTMSGTAGLRWQAVKGAQVIELWSKSQDGTNDVSANNVVADHLRLIATASDLGQVLLSEIQVYGEDTGTAWHRILPASVKAGRNTSFFYGAGNLFDGDIGSEWKVYTPFDDDDVLPNLENLIRGNWSHWWQDWNGVGDARVDAVLPAGKRVVKIQFYSGPDATGTVEIQGLYDGNWKSLGSVPSAPSTWTELASPYPDDLVQEIQIISHPKPGAAVQADLGEVYLWGAGNWTGDDYQDAITEGTDAAGGHFDFFQGDPSAPSEPYFEFAVQSQGSAALSVEVDGQGLGTVLPYVTSGSTSYYRVEVKSALVNEGENLFWVRGVTGQWLYGRLHTNNSDGSTSWTSTMSALNDGWKYVPTGTGQQLFPYSTGQSDGQWQLYGQGKLEAQTQGLWSEPNNIATSDGKIYPDWPQSAQVRLTPGDGGVGELKLAGVPLSPGSAAFTVLWPKNGQCIDWGDVMTQPLVGYTSSPGQSITVNGKAARTKGNLFWVSLHDLGLANGKMATLTVQSGSSGQTEKIGVAVAADPLWRISLDEQTITTTQDFQLVSGQVFVQGLEVFVGNQLLTPVQGGFKLDLPLQPGTNAVPVRLVYGPTGAVMETFTATIVRYIKGILLNVNGEGQTTYTTQSQYVVSGTVLSMNRVTVTVNGRRAQVSGTSFQATVSLKDGLNTLTVTASDHVYTATKVVQVFLDRSTPTLHLSSPVSGSWVSRSLTVSGAITDPAPAYLWVNGVRYAASSGTFNFQLPQLAEGPFTYQFQAQNQAGTYSAVQSVSFKVDNTPPLLFTIGANVQGWTRNNQPTITFSTTDSYSGVNHYEYAVSGGLWTSAMSPLRLPTLPDGNDEVDVRAFDNAGNVTVSAALFLIDTTPPKAVSSLSAIPGDGTIDVVWTTTDTDTVRYHVTRTPAWTDGELLATNPEVTESGLSNGSVYTYQVYAEDHAGNLGPALQTQATITGVSAQAVSQDPTQPTVVQYQGLKLVIPPALLPSEDKVVLVQEIESQALQDASNYPIVSPIYHISVMGDDGNGNLVESSHMEFDKEVVMLLDYDATKLPNGYPEANLGVYYFDTTWNKWFRVPKAAVDRTNKKILFMTNHFTDFSVQPTMIEDISPQELHDIGHSPFKTEDSEGQVTVSPQGGTAMTEVTDFVLPGRNGFSLPIKRIYDTQTARLDSPSLALSASLTIDFGNLSGLDIAAQLISSGVSNLTGAIANKLDSFLKHNGDYALSSGIGWRLNFPYVVTTSSSVLVRVPSGGYYNINQMNKTSYDQHGATRIMDFDFHEGDDFHFRVTQALGETGVKDILSSLAAQGASGKDAFKVIGDLSSMGSVKFNIQFLGELMPGWTTLAGELWTKDGTYYQFDGNGRIVLMRDKTGLNTYIFTYNGLLLDSITDDLGRQVKFQYNQGSTAAIFVKPVITRITTQGFQNQGASVSLNYDGGSSISYAFNFLPVLSSTVDPLGRTTSYHNSRLTLVSGGGSIKINFLALLLDICQIGFLNNLLGIHDLTLSGHIELGFPYYIDTITGPGIGTTLIDVTTQDISSFDARATDYFLGLFPTAIELSYEIQYRLVTDRVSVISSTGVRKDIYYSYGWSTANHESYVSDATINDGRLRTVENFTYILHTRNRFVSAYDMIKAYLTDFFSPEPLSIRELCTLLETTREYDARSGTFLGSTTTSWDSSNHRPLTTDVFRDWTTTSHTEYSYDNWGNTIHVAKAESTSIQDERTEKWMWYLNTASSAPGAWTADAFDSSEAQNNPWVRDQLLGTMTRVYQPSMNGGGYEDTLQAVAYNAYAQKKSEGIWFKNHWAKSSFLYFDSDPSLAYASSLQQVVGPTGQVTMYSYDYTRGPSGFYTTTLTQKAVQGPDGAAADITSATAYDWNTGWKVMDRSPRGFITSYSYDALGRIVDTRKPGDEAPSVMGGWSPGYLNASWEHIAYNDTSYTATVFRSTSSGGSGSNTQPFEKYSYDSLGQLIKIEKYNSQKPDASSFAMTSQSPADDITTLIGYDPWGDVVSLTDPNTHTTTFTYDMRGRLSRTTFADGKTISSEYDDQQSLKTTTNERGVVTQEWLDWSGQDLKKIEDADGQRIITKTYRDGAGRVAAVTDPLGQTTFTWYNQWGKPRQTQMPPVAVFMSPSAVSSASPVVPQVQTVVPLDVFDFDDSGNVISDKKGYADNWRETVLTMDGLGRVVTKNASGRTQWNWYDANGNVVQEGPVGIEADGQWHQYLTTRTYSSRNQLLTQTDPAGATTSYAYDFLDRKIGMTDPRGFRITYHYNDLGRLVMADLPPTDGTTMPHVILTYDPRGNSIQRLDPLGKTTVWQYDGRNRKIAETVSASDGSTPIARAWGYDESGNPVIEIETAQVNASDPSSSAGIALNRTFDALNRVTNERRADGQEKSYLYDDLGRVLRSWDVDYNTTFSTYNAFNKVVTLIDPAASRTDFFYNVWGDLTANAAPGSMDQGNQIWVRGYNPWSQIVYEKNNLGQSWTMAYDNVRGLAISGSDPKGTQSASLYSLTGLLTQRTLINDGSQESQSYSYDPAGALIQAEDGGVSSLFNSASGSYVPNAYDLVKDLQTTVNGKTLGVAYSYDLEQKPVHISYPDGFGTSNQYNALGELVSIPGYATGGQYNFQGRLTSLTAANGTSRTKVWDARTGTLDGYAWPGTGKQARTLTWDKKGNLLTQTKEGRTSQYSYDVLNQLYYAQEALSVEVSADSSQSWGSTEDDAGGTLRLTTDNGDERVKLDYHATSIGVDLGSVLPVNRLRLLGTSPRLTQQTVELYLSSDNSSWQLVTGWHWSVTPDGTDLLLSQAISAEFVKLHVTWDELDVTNAPVDHSTVSGTPSQLVEVWFTANGQESYWTYDALGNRISAEKLVAGQVQNLIYSYYSPSDEIKYIKLGNNILWAFTYDANGNLVQRATGAFDNNGIPDFTHAVEIWLYSYDLQNRLISVKRGLAGSSSVQEVASYSYDHRGLRVLAAEGGQSVYYQYDQSEGLIYRDNGTEKRDYIRALGQVWAEVRTTGQTSHTYFHHTDHEGSTEAITDSNGNMVWQAGYEAFGGLVSHNGTIDNEGLYTGKEYDQYAGLYYSNARWYDPTLGRFITEDPARDGDNWFAYVSNNPLRYVDPTGLGIGDEEEEKIEPYAYSKFYGGGGDGGFGSSAALSAEERIAAESAAKAPAGLNEPIAQGEEVTPPTTPAAAEPNARAQTPQDVTKAPSPKGAQEQRTTTGKPGNRQPSPSVAENATSANSAAALDSKLAALQKAQQNATTVRELPDGKVRYYSQEVPATTPGRTRGASYVTEWDPSTGTVRSWMESYDQAGNVNRVHPKMTNGQDVNAQHYPSTKSESHQ